MSGADESQQKLPKLIVVIAFDLNGDGQLETVFGPQDFQTEDRAIRTAQSLANTHRGVIAWSREANIHLGEYGPPTTLFVSGDVQIWSKKVI